MEIEYMEGVITGSMEKVERRTSGVLDDTMVGRVECSSVTGNRVGAMERDGRREREGYIVRGGADVGVTMSRVRMRSRGARARAAIAVAATATERDIRGLGLSMISRPPMPLTAVPINPGSGTLRSAERRLRVQLSVVFSRKLYTKVTLVPFQTPHADSFCHNCEMTSSRASDLRSSSLRGARGGAWVGVEELERLGACRGRLPGDRDAGVGVKGWSDT